MSSPLMDKDEFQMVRADASATYFEGGSRDSCPYAEGTEQRGIWLYYFDALDNASMQRDPDRAANAEDYY